MTELKPEFSVIYDQLVSILRQYANEPLQLHAGKLNQAELIGPSTPKSKGKQVWFGAVRLGKRYVSYHLMAVYACPDLLDSISPELKKRMQGKSCFNFTHVDEALFQELDQLTQRGYDRFKQMGLIESK